MEERKVIELAWHYPGPLAGRLLAEWGFDIIKVEPPGGDPVKRLSPTFYQWLNEGKTVVYLDLRQLEDRKRLFDLVRGARAVISSFRRVTAERFGISYGALREVNPDILYVAIVGYINRDSPGHDINFAGLAGLIRDTPPIPQCVDVATGLLAAFVIAATIATRRRGYVEVSMEGVAYLLNLLNFALLKDTGNLPLSGVYPFYNIYKCIGGSIALGAVEDKFWRRFCEMLGREDLVGRMYDHSAVDEVRKEMVKRRCDDLIALAEKYDVPLTPVRNISEAGAMLPAIDILLGRGKKLRGQR